MAGVGNERGLCRFLRVNQGKRGEGLGWLELGFLMMLSFDMFVMQIS